MKNLVIAVGFTLFSFTASAQQVFSSRWIISSNYTNGDCSVGSGYTSKTEYNARQDAMTACYNAGFGFCNGSGTTVSGWYRTNGGPTWYACDVTVSVIGR